MKMGKTFVRGKQKYILAEKKELGELVEKYKKEYDKEVKTLQGKTHYDYKRKKHVPIKPKQGFHSFSDSPRIFQPPPPLPAYYILKGHQS